jgi:hypothetical protein
MQDAIDRVEELYRQLRSEGLGSAKRMVIQGKIDTAVEQLVSHAKYHLANAKK